MRRAAAVVLVCLLAPLGASSAGAQAGDPVGDVVLDLFQELPVGPMDVVLECENSRVRKQVDQRSFTFAETDAAEVPDPLPGFNGSGLASRGCAQVRLEVAVPPGSEHVHVRFLADRSVNNFARTTVAFQQEVRVRTLGGDLIYSHAYFAEDATSEELTFIDAPAATLTGNPERVVVEWHFADVGSLQGEDPLSGQDYAAEVVRPQLEFSGIAVPFSQDRHGGREGTLRLDRLDVGVAVEDATPAPYRAALRVSVDDAFEFRDLITPNGQRFSDVATRDPGASGVLGIDEKRLLQERLGGQLRITVPQALLETMGAGDYTFRFQQVAEVRTNPVLVTLSIVLLAMPMPFAAVAVYQARIFQREAFGGFRRSARNLSLAVGFVAAYYLAVVLSAFAGGRLDLMSAWPMPLEAVLLYAQVVLAGVAFIGLWLVARELYRITKPA